MALYGDNLAKSIRDGTTWGEGTDICGILETALNSQYSSLDGWRNFLANGIADTANRAIWELISPADGVKIKDDLDGAMAATMALDSLILARVEAEGRDGAMTADYRAKLQATVALASATIAVVDTAFHSSVAGAVSDSIVPVVGGIGDKIANALSALLGNFLGGIWWILVLAILGFMAYKRWWKGAAA